MAKDNMTLLEHLDELRKRLTIIALVNIVAALLLFGQADRVMTYLLDVNPGLELVYITPSELLVVYIQISFIIALIICSPITIYQIWAFIEKGLYKREKAYVLITLFFGAILFVVGVLFCYLLVLPTTLEFFIRIAIDDVASMVSIGSYMSFVNMMLLAFGVVFEIPVLVFLLTKLGVMSSQFLKKNRGLLIVLIFIVAAFVTPPDVISQLMLGVPMVLLMELSIIICKIVERSNRKKIEETSGRKGKKR